MSFNISLATYVWREEFGISLELRYHSHIIFVSIFVKVPIHQMANRELRDTRNQINWIIFGVLSNNGNWKPLNTLHRSQINQMANPEPRDIRNQINQIVIVFPINPLDAYYGRVDFIYMQQRTNPKAERAWSSSPTKPDCFCLYHYFHNSSDHLINIRINSSQRNPRLSNCQRLFYGRCCLCRRTRKPINIALDAKQLWM